MSGEEIIVAIIVGAAALSLLLRFVGFFKKAKPKTGKAPACDSDCNC